MKFKHLESNLLIFFLSFFLLSNSAFSLPYNKGIFSTADSLLQIEAYNKADNLSDKPQRLEALKNFISDYPQSPKTCEAYIELFSIYLNNIDIDSALRYASLAVKSAPEQLILSVYTEISYALARKKAGLDVAKEYTQKVIYATRSDAANYLKYSGLSYDTQALVMFDRNNLDSAVIVEKQALGINRDNPVFLSKLAVYMEAAGMRLQALNTAAKAIALGNVDDALINFDKWIGKEKPAATEQAKLRKSIADSTWMLLFGAKKDKSIYTSNSSAAAFFTCLKTNLKQTEKWNHEALKSLDYNFKINDRIIITKNYALMLLAEGKYKQSAALLDSIKNLVDLRDGNTWYTIGKAYERINENQKALDAYISGSVLYQPATLASALRDMSFKMGITENKIRSFSKEKQNSLSSFDPGHFSGIKSKDNVMLAELFTDAESYPCISADSAFAYIAKYFDRSEVAILDYHLHISGPDPMSNPDTYKRLAYYGNNFGTPTVIIQGNVRVDGGGPRDLIRNKFETYKYTLESLLKGKPTVKLMGSARFIRDSVAVSLQFNKAKPIDDNNSLHMAIVEKSIRFPSGNGIKNNIYVVRGLFNGVNGLPVKSEKGVENISAAFNITEVENIISKYLKDPNNDAAWTAGFRVHWLGPMTKLNRDNLCIVAWVQNNKTKEVLQSIYLDVPGNKLSEGIK